MIPTQLSEQTIHQIAMLDNTIGYAVGQSGMLRTMNSGRSWHDIGLDVPLTALLATPSLLIGAGVGRILQSTDMGQTWTTIALPVPTSVPSTIIQIDDALYWEH